MAKTKITTFTSTGRAVSGIQRSSVPAASLGRFDPNTGRVYQRPRLKENILEGSSVKITNPTIASTKANQRTESIGAGAAGQKNRYT